MLVANLKNQTKFLSFALVYKSSLIQKQRNKEMNKQTKKQVTEILINSI